MEEKDKKEKEEGGEGEKKHVCTVCGRASDTTICQQCEEKIRGEMLDHKHDVDKAGRTDSGRR